MSAEAPCSFQSTKQLDSRLLNVGTAFCGRFLAAVVGDWSTAGALHLPPRSPSLALDTIFRAGISRSSCGFQVSFIVLYHLLCALLYTCSESDRFHPLDLLGGLSHALLLHALEHVFLQEIRRNEGIPYWTGHFRDTKPRRRCRPRSNSAAWSTQLLIYTSPESYVSSSVLYAGSSVPRSLHLHPWIDIIASAFNSTPKSQKTRCFIVQSR